LAPPDFVTNWVRIGTALLTSSGFSPSFENADAATASPAADPPSCDSAPDVPTALPAAGAALSSVAMPGTAPDTCENSSGFRRDFASEKSAPAAPADCSGVAASSFDSAPTSSGLAFAAAEAAVADCGSPARAVAPATENIANRAAQANADMLIIADRTLSTPAVEEIADAARAAGLTVAKLPTLDELLTPLPGPPPIPAPRTGVEEVLVAAPPAVEPRRASTPDAAALSRTKRLLDIALSLVAVVLVVPLVLLIAVVLKFTAGEVIYRAPRIGRDGQLFTMFKFVTMSRDDSGPRVTGRNDVRITDVGRWLRATKLNELPQLLNVIKGEMSLVGPRPEDPRYATHYSARHRQVLAVRPGLTSLAFLRFGDEEAFIARARPVDVEAYYLEELLPQKLDIELDYVSTWSVGQDLRILAGTLRAMLR